MIEKAVDVGSWTKLAECPTELVRVSRRGLIGADRTNFVKRASHVFAEFLDRVKLASDEIPIHVIAVCSHEGYGFNRNADGFSERDCINHHDTFVKHGRHYEHHKNKDPEKSFGDVRLSAYNKPMRRIELLVIGNATKAAALRNGGLVLDSSVIDSLERGDDVPWSMACKVAYDVCINCGNKAPSRASYCTEDNCLNVATGRRGFGCKEGLLKMADDGYIQGVLNPNADWFDISRVGRPAEREAYGWMATYLQKAASCDRVVGGAELAEKYAAANGYQLLSPAASRDLRRVEALQRTVQKLAQVETRVAAGLTDQDRSLGRAFQRLNARLVDFDLAGVLGSPGSTKAASTLAELSKRSTVLALPLFVRWLGVSEKTAEDVSRQVAERLPGVFGRMLQDPVGTENLLKTSLFRPSNTPATLQQRQAVEKLAGDFSLEPETLRSRIERSVLAGNDRDPQLRTVKQAAAQDDPAEGLARQYACYVAEALTGENEKCGNHLTTLAAVLQNQVS